MGLGRARAQPDQSGSALGATRPTLAESDPSFRGQLLPGGQGQAGTNIAALVAAAATRQRSPPGPDSPQMTPKGPTQTKTSLASNKAIWTRPSRPGRAPGDRAPAGRGSGPRAAANAATPPELLRVYDSAWPPNGRDSRREGEGGRERKEQEVGMKVRGKRR